MISKVKENKTKIPLYLFYLALTIELVIVIIDRSAIPPLPEGQLYRLTFALFALKVCFTRYTKKEWLWLILFTLFTAAMYLITGQNIALRAVFFVAAMRDINIKPTMKYAFWLTLSGFMLIIILSFFGIGRDIKSTEIFRGVEQTRYHFGIGHPNTFYCMILMLIFLLFYCYQEKLKISTFIVIFIANTGLFLLADSRTGFIVCTLAIIMAAALNWSPKLSRSNWIYYTGMIILLCSIGFSVWAAYYGDSLLLWTEGSWLDRIDAALTRRIRNLYWDRPLNDASLKGWTLFSEARHFERVFDMGWVRLFFWFGIIPGTVFSILHLLLINVCRLKKDHMGLMMVVIAAIYTIVEPQFISLYLGRNYLLYLFGAYWGTMLWANTGDALYWWRFLRVILSEAKILRI